MDGLKILWHSNAPFVNTGYGVETRVFCPRIQEQLGHEVTISSFYGLQGATLSYKNIMVLPSYTDPFGNDILRAHARFLDSDLVITLLDCWVLDPKRMAMLPWTPWLPIDHFPAPPPVINTLKKGKALPITFSRFGQNTLIDAGFDPVLYVPHSPEEIFYTNVDRGEAKTKFGWEDKFVIGMVAANKGFPCRKAFPEVFQAVGKFLSTKERRERTVLYLHTEVRSPYGVRLDAMLESCGVPPDNVRFVDHYRYIIGMLPDYMIDVYNAMDVLVNTSMGEGFGIPIIEAQACGTPVIVTDFSAMSELCFSGHKVSGRPFYTGQASWQVQPNIDEIVEALEIQYELSEAKRKEETALARRKALEYHPDLVTEKYWKPTLEQAYEMMSKRDDLEDVDFDPYMFTGSLDDHKMGMD